jgi:starch synthase (maltosyl-transferring)
MPPTGLDRVADGRRRVVIAAVNPSVDGGRFPAKRTLGDRVQIAADALVDGHDRVAALLRVRAPGTESWREIPMRPAGAHAIDRFVADLVVDRLGTWHYGVEAWVDHFASWRHGLERKVAADQDVSVDLLVGARLIAQAADRARERGSADAASLASAAKRLGDAAVPHAERTPLALSDDLAAAVARHPDRTLSTTLDQPIPLLVERVRARFSSWYELFPRSFGEGGRHGTLRDAAEIMLPYVAELGFDVVYLPPIYPIGRTFRKGKNNATTSQPGEPGSPWAIGGPEGGHDALHPELGTLADFAAFVERARQLGIEVALDIAFQASPDHPWVKQHPGWFVHRPDGTIQYAENPPKKYQDVYPFDFECEDWRGLWRALADVFHAWAARGVRVFRVDNPHTKALPFWEWCLADVRARWPDAIFLSEAFTRPLLLHRLAKLGYSQSYTYFTWRTTARELRAYCEELVSPEQLEYLRPNFWPNTPDILPEQLQIGGRAAFAMRAILAATLTASWGMYGPAYELQDARPVPGKEEYLDSEKYELKRWDLDAPHSLRHLIARLNKIRRQHPALQQDRTLRFHEATDDALLVYSKTASDDAVLCVVNCDPFHRRAGFIELDLEALGLPAAGSYQVHDLVSDARYLWYGARNYVELDPEAVSGHVFAVRRLVHREQSFDYYL